MDLAFAAVSARIGVFADMGAVCSTASDGEVFYGQPPSRAIQPEPKTREFSRSRHSLSL